MDARGSFRGGRQITLGARSSRRSGLRRTKGSLCRGSTGCHIAPIFAQGNTRMIPGMQRPAHKNNITWISMRGEAGPLLQTGRPNRPPSERAQTRTADGRGAAMQRGREMYGSGVELVGDGEGGGCDCFVFRGLRLSHERDRGGGVAPRALARAFEVARGEAASTRDALGLGRLFVHAPWLLASQTLEVCDARAARQRWRPSWCAPGCWGGGAWGRGLLW